MVGTANEQKKEEKVIKNIEKADRERFFDALLGLNNFPVKFVADKLGMQQYEIQCAFNGKTPRSMNYEVFDGCIEVFEKKLEAMNKELVRFKKVVEDSKKV